MPSKPSHVRVPAGRYESEKNLIKKQAETIRKYQQALQHPLLQENAKLKKENATLCQQVKNLEASTHLDKEEIYCKTREMDMVNRSYVSLGEKADGLEALLKTARDVIKKMAELL